MSKYTFYCPDCGAELIRVAQEEWKCPTCQSISESDFNERVNLKLKKKTNMFENLGDKGKQVKDLENSLEIKLAIKKLKPKQKRIIKMIDSGYTWREIQKKLKVGQHTIERLLAKIRLQITK